jgi:menaquinone-dependent protoporphyrinogen IX oxidase
MNLGMIVYSLSGNTLSVAEKLKEKLSAAGHAVTLKRVETIGVATLQNEEAELKTQPAIETYDAVIFSTPVRGGKLPSPMERYLEQVPSLEKQNVALLVTGFFPVAGWGREQVITELKDACKSKGAQILGAASVGWFSLNRKQQIARAVDTLRNLF